MFCEIKFLALKLVVMVITYCGGVKCFFEVQNFRDMLHKG